MLLKLVQVEQVQAQDYNARNGNAGGDSYFINATTVKAWGGQNGGGGTYTGDGGGNGGIGDASILDGAGGGGAGGYQGNGGAGSTKVMVLLDKVVQQVVDLKVVMGNQAQQCSMQVVVEELEYME